MTRPDDSYLSASQLNSVQRHADQLLNDAAALGRFPTPIDDLMAAAKLTVVPDQMLNEGFLRQFMNKTKAGVVAVKTALSKILGLFDSYERLVVIDKKTPKPRVPFIKLHEAGHGSLPHQSKLYRFIHDCEKTLDPDVRDLFEREANVFASEVLFQGSLFSKEAHEQSFGMSVPMDLAKKYGASNYSTFRRYVSTSHRPCCVVVLEPPIVDEGDIFAAEVRRVVMSTSFNKLYNEKVLGSMVCGSHPLMPAVPKKGRRMTRQTEVVLEDRNGDDRVCIVEAFDTTHNRLILILDTGRHSKVSMIVPAFLSA